MLAIEKATEKVAIKIKMDLDLSESEAEVEYMGATRNRAGESSVEDESMKISSTLSSEDTSFNEKDGSTKRFHSPFRKGKDKKIFLTPN